MKTDSVLNQSESVPEIIKIIERNINLIKELHATNESLQEQIALDIIEGWSTGDRVHDFYILASDGLYDESLFQQYKELSEIGLTNPRKTVIVAQIGLLKLKLTFEGSDDQVEIVTLVKNMYLASLRAAPTLFNLDKMTISLPVEPAFFKLREAFGPEGIIDGYRIVNEDYLTIGALPTQNRPHNYTRSDGDGFHYTSQDSSCLIVLMPIQSALTDYGITNEDVAQMMKDWMKLRSTTKALANS